MLSSMNPLPAEEVTPLNENLSKQKNMGMNLSDIPHFTPSSSRPKEPLLQTQNTTSCLAPLSFDDGRMEYEFTCIFTDSRPMFIGLWDTDDLSACQRVSASNMDREEIVYNKDTGIGFFNTCDGLRWCFKKKPTERSMGPFNLLDSSGDEERPKRSKESAEDILAGL